MTLKEYLAASGETVEAFAARVGASPGMVHKIVYRQRQPSLSLAARIEENTAGKVAALDMLLPTPADAQVAA